ncbi:hypothetical protein C2857_007662 [Epichloe festucae Fl1]|uniref:Charged multivesicular body protein 5 n=2 Tax=Epichloe TaxID=5112 RepID=A0A7S9KQY8_EPIFF|nr:hypothetical protein C2857_007662 [Epichloe festucae Fl1]
MLPSYISQLFCSYVELQFQKRRQSTLVISLSTFDADAESSREQVVWGFHPCLAPPKAKSLSSEAEPAAINRPASFVHYISTPRLSLSGILCLTLRCSTPHAVPSAQNKGMNRLFGSKPPAPKPTLGGAISNIDTRIASIDTKLKALNGELSAYQEKLSKMREGPGKQAIKQKALKVLQRRKAYEAEKEKLEGQVWNMEQASSMQDNLKNVMTQVDAMKTTNKELKKQYGKIDIDKIERLQDEMADLMDVGNEIQDSLARSYDIPDEVDESELDAELEALGMEQELEMEMGGAVPGFLQDEVAPEFIDEPPQMEDKVKEAAG